MACRFRIALATVVLAACGGADQPPAPTPTPRTASVAATPSPSRPTTAQTGRPGCDVEIDIECPAGMIDGCAGQPRYSDRHVCVRP